MADQITVDEARNVLENGGFGNGLQDAQVDPDDAGVDGAAIDDFIKSFGVEGSTPYKAYDWIVQVPSHYLKNNYTGPLYGILRAETESIYIIDTPTYTGDGSHLIGAIGDETANEDVHEGGYWLSGAYDGNGLSFHLVEFLNGYKVADYPVQNKPYDTTVNLFSRNTGLLESDVMLDKCAVLIGVGSVGSFVAMELARSGVGKFVLIDTDTLEVHNICRHQCGFDDLGRYKVDAVRDKILNINPNAEVVTFKSVIQRIPESELLPYLGRNTVIVGGGDNRASADYGCKLACRTDSAFVATCCWTRAFAGEVFYWQSGHGLSCYECALGGLIDAERPESHARYFGTEEDEASLAFEPGVAVDIDFVTIIAVKLCLDLLNRDNNAYTPRVIEYLKQYTWISNTNSTAIGGERAAIFTHPLQITTSLSVRQRPDCEDCATES